MWHTIPASIGASTVVLYVPARLIISRDNKCLISDTLCTGWTLCIARGRLSENQCRAGSPETVPRPCVCLLSFTCKDCGLVPSFCFFIFVIDATTTTITTLNPFFPFCEMAKLLPTSQYLNPSNTDAADVIGPIECRHLYCRYTGSRAF